MNDEVCEASSRAIQLNRDIRARLSKVLGTMYTAHERFSSIEVTFRSWFSPNRLDLARSELGLSDSRANSKIEIMSRHSETGGGNAEIPDVVDSWFHLRVSVTRTNEFRTDMLDGWSRIYYPSGRGFSQDDPQHYIGAIEDALFPMRYISDLELTEVEEITTAGQKAIVLRGVTRRHNRDVSGFPLGVGSTEHELIVDVERGILLELTSSHRGRPVAGNKIRQITFDPPISNADTERWEEISETVGLLYRAKSSFTTVTMSISRHAGHGIADPGLPTHGGSDSGDSITRLWVDNPARFREETSDSSGRQTHIVNGDVWWRLTTDDVSTNAPLEILRGFGAVSVGEHEMHQIYEDSEYAIISQLYLDPSWLISRMWIEPVERTVWLGRDAIRVRGEPIRTGHWLDHAEEALWANADEYDLLIDAERGILLRMAALLKGEEKSIREVTEVTFDCDILDDMFIVTPDSNMSVNIPAATVSKSS